MTKLVLSFLVAVPSLIIGIALGYLFTATNPSIFAPTWPTEAAAQEMLDAYLSMDAFGGADGVFTITKTDSGVWVILKDDVN